MKSPIKFMQEEPIICKIIRIFKVFLFAQQENVLV